MAKWRARAALQAAETAPEITTLHPPERLTIEVLPIPIRQARKPIMPGPILARDIMVTKLITLSPEMKLREAAKLLLKNRISGAPVVNGQGELIGIFSEQDVMSALIDAVYDDLPSTEVRNYMSEDLYTIHEDLDLLSIAQVFRSKGFRRLPVVRDQKLVGQISRRDVMSAVVSLLEPVADRKSGVLYLSALREPPHAPLE